MTGLRTMASIVWRGHRRRLVAWTVGLAVVFVLTAWSLHDLYPTPADLATYARATDSGTALYAINGRPFGLDSIGGVIAYEFGFVSAIGFPLMGLLLITRMTRAEEQSGRWEVLRAGTVGRVAPTAAALLWTTAALAAIGVAMVATLAALGLGWPGVLLYPVSVTLLGLGFAAVAALAAQVVRASRAVSALGLGVLALAVLARGVGDVGGNLLVWLSPVGWAEQTRPFGEARWWPALLALGFVLVVSAAALRLAGRRDLGAGLVASRPGPTRAAAPLLGQIGFAARQHRGPVLTWSIIGALVAVSFGALAEAIRTAMEDNATLQDVFGEGSADADGFLSFVVVLVVLVCIGFAVQGVGRLAEEERDGRLEAVLAGTVTRTRWLAGHLVALVVGTVVVALVGAVALGLSAGLALGDAREGAHLVGATAAYLPATLLVLALAVLLHGLGPDLVGIAWVYVAYVVLVSTLADALQLPDLARDLSPLAWVGRAPADPVHGWAVAGTALAAMLAAGAGAAALRRRDLGWGSHRAWSLRRAADEAGVLVARRSG